MKSGVYRIVNTVNQKQYVGSSSRLSQRIGKHRHYLRLGVHPNRHLSNAWVKHGETAFVFEILEECEPEQLIEREQHWIDTLRPEYNLAPVAGRTIGVVASEETRAKLRAAWEKRGPVSDATRAKLSAAGKGRKPSEANRIALRAAHAGRVISPEQRAKMAAGRRGKKFSAESSARLSAAMKGRPKSDEHKRKIGDANRGKKHTPEFCEMIRLRNLGRVASEETLEKMRATQLGKVWGPEFGAKVSAGKKAAAEKRRNATSS